MGTTSSLDLQRNQTFLAVPSALTHSPYVLICLVLRVLTGCSGTNSQQGLVGLVVSSTTTKPEPEPEPDAGVKATLAVGLG